LEQFTSSVRFARVQLFAMSFLAPEKAEQENDADAYRNFGIGYN
jgi:hypothetical protein